MGNIMKKLLITGIAISISLMTGCGAEDVAPTQSEEIDPDKIVIATAPPSETDVADIADTKVATQTPSGVSVESKEQKYSVTQGCNVRKDCSGDSELVSSLFYGDVVQGTGICENGWIQIEYNGASAYVTGSCLTPTEDGEAMTGDPTETEPSEEGASVDITEFFEDTGVSKEVDVSDWAKYTSSKWEVSDRTSCFLQIHSVAGNQVIFRLQVVDGALSEISTEGVLVAEIPNCTGKIQNGILGFSFTDSYGNLGVGKIEIVDDTHLSIATVITQEAEGADYQAAIMATLAEVSD